MPCSNDDDDVNKKAGTPQFDPRFPNTNQTYNCFVNYVDYYRCIDLFRCNKGRCEPFRRVFEAICPNAWVNHWDEQREAGTFPRDIVHVPRLSQFEDEETECKNQNKCG